MLHNALEKLANQLSRNKLSILIYHQVLAEPDPMRPSEPTAAVFDWQMQLLSKYFCPLSLDQALHHLEQNTLPRNSVCVTFDDGYLNNLTVAQPILAKYGIPATVYVATGFSHGRNMWNDRLIHLFADPQKQQLQLNDEILTLGDWDDRRTKAQQWLKKLKYLPLAQRLEQIDLLYQQNNASEQSALMMTAEQIRQLSECGITIGAHTVNHPILKVLPEHEQLAEIQKSKQQLETWLKQPVLHFAYPNGVEGVDFDDVTVKLVQNAGFSSAVVTNWGISTPVTQRLKLKRFTPWDKTPLRFHLRLVMRYF
ncbi:polysaccharide deacetylase family protein [Alishewanella jeotgali]|uniref:Polysaccharide deacetylase n=1 Tax=Alishewanella jeotgali KCTC 22429 TaxID=1129374 RepID=H3ZB96_9ALTE|nr:polysaccharide deacetylase family protein [Alishewanella jeotgali]EHR42210.1 polysaccharide deacetylase [Alishewanella jeotgali KCTC 22429]